MLKRSLISLLLLSSVFSLTATVRADGTKKSLLETGHWAPIGARGAVKTIANSSPSPADNATELTLKQNGSGTFSGIIQKIPNGMAQISGRTLTFSFWVMSSRAGSLNVLFRDSDARSPTPSILKSLSYKIEPQEINQWKQVHLVFDMPPNLEHSHNLQVYLAANIDKILLTDHDTLVFAGEHLLIGEHTAQSSVSFLAQPLAQPHTTPVLTPSVSSTVANPSLIDHDRQQVPMLDTGTAATARRTEKKSLLKMGHWAPIGASGQVDDAANDSPAPVARATRLTLKQEGSGTFSGIIQKVPGGMAQISGQTLTFSFWVMASRAGALNVIFRDPDARAPEPVIIKSLTYKIEPHEINLWKRVHLTIDIAGNLPYAHNLQVYLASNINNILQTNMDSLVFAGEHLLVGKHAVQTSASCIPQPAGSPEATQIVRSCTPPAPSVVVSSPPLSGLGQPDILIPDMTAVQAADIATLAKVVESETAWKQYQSKTPAARMLFSDIHPGPITKDAFTKRDFAHKLRLYLALMEKYPQQFTTDIYSLFNAIFPANVATNYACNLVTLEELLPQVQQALGLSANTPVTAVAPGHQTPPTTSHSQLAIVQQPACDMPVIAGIPGTDPDMHSIVKAYDSNLNPSAMSYLYRFDAVIDSEQSRYLAEKYFIQVMRSGGNCLYMAYLSGWLHALVEDIVTGKNHDAIRNELTEILSNRTEFRQFLAEAVVQIIGIQDTTDDLVNFLIELNDDPSIANLHQMIMPDQWVTIQTPEGYQVKAWGGKEERLERLAQYFRNYAVYLKRKNLLEERDQMVALDLVQGFPEVYNCKAEVHEFSVMHEELNLNPIDTVMLYQAQPGVWATDMEMQMLNQIRPFSLCFQSTHPNWDSSCDDTQGFKPYFYPEGQRIVILQRQGHYEALIPTDTCAQ